MIRNRVRVRFRKEGDLRLISHRDLVRAFERLFRRAGLRLRMSEGFHPHPRMTFPSALSLGIAGRDEVMEVELAEEATAEELLERIAPHLPAGLAIERVECLAPSTPKAKIARVQYEVALPEHLRGPTQRRIERLLAAETCRVERREGRPPIDVRADIERLEIVDGVLHMRLRASPQGGAQCRDVLKALELDDVQLQGALVCRSRVELVQ